MTLRKFFSSLVIFLSFVFRNNVGLYGQLTPTYNPYDSNYYSKADQAQFKDFLYHLGHFPPLPKNKFEVGVHVGMVNITGDVVSKATPLGVDVSIRKALGYVFSIRGQYVFGIASGQNTLATPIMENEVSTYQRYRDNNINSAVKNYQTTLHQFNVQIIANLNNIDFSRKAKKYNFYILAGVGYVFQNTLLNIFDGNNLYNYDINTGRIVGEFDNSYETSADFANKNAFVLSTGLGFQYKINDRVNLQIENQFSFSSSIYLDGSADQHSVRSVFDFNQINYLSAGVNINLGPKHSTQPLYWLNPLEYLYTEINSPRSIKMPEPHLTDADKDGVADLLDKEETTLPGVPVDAKGVTLDTDGDGVPDYKDKELITPSFCLPANKEGIGTCPKTESNNSCCQEIMSKLKSLETTKQKTHPTILDTVYEIEEENTPQLPLVPEKKEIESATPKTQAPTRSDIQSAVMHMSPDCYLSNLIHSLSNQIIFKYNSETLVGNSMNILNNITEQLKQNKKIQIVIQGKIYPYEIKDSLNRLDIKRRNFLSNFFMEEGIAENRIAIKPIEETDYTDPFIKVNNDEFATCPNIHERRCSNGAINYIAPSSDYLKNLITINQYNADLKFQKGDVALKNFKNKYKEGIATILKQNPNYQLIISAPYDIDMLKPDAKGQSIMSMQRSQKIKDILINDSKINATQLAIVPINLLQPAEAVPLFRIIPNSNFDFDQDCVVDIKDKCPTVSGDAKYDGCLVSSDLIDSMNAVSKNILFDFDKDIIRPSSYSYLNGLAQLIIKNKFLVTIAGQTDEIGNDAHNLQLSYNRAVSVKKYLVDKGVPEKYLQSIGLGEQQSITDTEEEKAFFRRVDFLVTGIDNSTL